MQAESDTQRGHGAPGIGPRDASRYDRLFANRAAAVKSSAMRDLMALSEQPDIISLAGGFPDTESFPLDIYAEVVAAMQTGFRASSLQYGPTEGLWELRERIVEVMAHEGALTRPDDVLVTTGGQQAIDLSVRTFVDPGDVVLAEGPTYPGAVPCFTTYEAEVEHVPMDDNGLRIDLLEERLDLLDRQGVRPKLLYTIPNFHNPAGVTMSRERRERLIRIAHERELLIVEDNPYGQIRFEGESLPSLWELDDGEGWVVYLSTFSKILAPGVRVGWVAAPPPVLRKMNLGKQAADLCSSTFTQRFIVEYMRRFDWREHVNRLNEVYRNRRDTMVRALEEEMPAEVTWSEPKGGLFLWATLPDPLDTTELLAEATRDERVAFVPGRGAFLNGDGARSMRLNFSGASEPMIAEGIARLGRSVARQLELARQLFPDS